MPLEPLTTPSPDTDFANALHWAPAIPTRGPLPHLQRSRLASTLAVPPTGIPQAKQCLQRSDPIIQSAITGVEAALTRIMGRLEQLCSKTMLRARVPPEAVRRRHQHHPVPGRQTDDFDSLRAGTRSSIYAIKKRGAALLGRALSAPDGRWGARAVVLQQRRWPPPSILWRIRELVVSHVEAACRRPSSDRSQPVPAPPTASARESARSGASVAEILVPAAPRRSPPLPRIRSTTSATTIIASGADVTRRTRFASAHLLLKGGWLAAATSRPSVTLASERCRGRPERRSFDPQPDAHVDDAVMQAIWRPGCIPSPVRLVGSPGA